MMPSPSRWQADALSMMATRFRLMGDPTRLGILQELRGGELSLLRLREAVGCTQASLGGHLRALQGAAVVTRRAQDHCVYFSVTDTSVFTLLDLTCLALRGSLEALPQGTPSRAVDG